MMESDSRPPYDKRTFHSEEVDNYIASFESKFKDKDLYKLFSNCYPNTLDTTIDYDKDKKETFIITGDITAMWLRDSSLQIYPYLKHCAKDSSLSDMIKGLFKKQISFVLLDPYANAFNKKPLESPWINDKTYKNCSECHIRPDWLLIYKYVDDKLVLVLFAIGSHSELFNK